MYQQKTTKIETTIQNYCPCFKKIIILILRWKYIRQQTWPEFTKFEMLKT